ncbi:MAG: hypothetical protein EAZ71_09690 [Verrucomicrobia bacterium]|nr:MAG: hypothetical protein EAZ82_09465 [Verrucomicrobiota bacterium]TAF24758.1 MAG: hypothetical protein EAZ71_09690 [Verrucomicrobiota bacterium]
MKTLLVALITTFIATAFASAAESIDRAKKLFAEYTTLAKNFDPDLAALYSDKAKIENTRVYPDGRKQALKLDPKEYKSLLRKVMPLAKARGDTSTYSEVNYLEAAPNVTITANRFSTLKKYQSPVTIMVGPDTDGEWRILEEKSESRP